MAEEVDASSFGALEQRVAGLERAVTTLADEIRGRSQIPWGAVSACLVALGLVMAFAVWGFNAYIGGTQQSILLVQQATSERMDRFEAALMKVQDGIVPRGEHEGKWVTQANETANVQRQIDQMREELGSSFSLNDALQSISERIARLEELRLQQTVPRP
jgi:Flp pilus assembly protein TadB